MPYCAIHARSTSAAAQVVSCGANCSTSAPRRIVDQRHRAALGPRASSHACWLPSSCTNSPKCAFRSRRWRYGRTVPPPAATSRRRASSGAAYREAHETVFAREMLGGERRAETHASVATVFLTNQREDPLPALARPRRPIGRDGPRCRCMSARRAPRLDTADRAVSPGDSSRPHRAPHFKRQCPAPTRDS